MDISDISTGAPEFYNLLIKSRQTEYDERPDYPYYIKCIQKIMIKKHLENDNIFDWTTKRSHKLTLPNYR